ncbi:MAG TPA: histidine phosphatase family protein [Nitrososphaerales archaeon]|nr:histidine phosphatase family protein [Nitrososphaerales archaeon]
MENLFVVRHGETKANENDIDAGSLDFPLTKRGKKEAAFIAKSLAPFDIDVVCSSPVRRAVQTARILAKPHGLNPKLLDDLDEAKLKPNFVGKSGRHHILESPEAFQETYQELQGRVLRAVNRIRAESKTNAIMVSHGDVIVALLQHVVERREERPGYYVLHPNPGSLSIIQFTDRPRLVLFDYRRKLLGSLQKSTRKEKGPPSKTSHKR